MPDKPRLSFIIPTYNSSRTISETLQSISRETAAHPDLAHEIIVIDDGSSDNTLDLVRTLPGVRLIAYGHNQGPAVTRNRGIREAQGDWLFFLDADVSLVPGALERLLPLLTDAELIHISPICPDGKPLIEDRHCHGYARITACFLLARHVLDRLDERFDETYWMHNEDTDFFLRLQVAGVPCRMLSGEGLANHGPRKDLNTADRHYYELRNLLYGHLKLSWIPLSLRPGFPDFACGWLYRVRLRMLFTERQKLGLSRREIAWMLLRILHWNLVRYPRVWKKKRAIRQIIEARDALLREWESITVGGNRILQRSQKEEGK